MAWDDAQGRAVTQARLAIFRIPPGLTRRDGEFSWRF